MENYVLFGLCPEKKSTFSVKSFNLTQSVSIIIHQTGENCVFFLQKTVFRPIVIARSAATKQSRNTRLSGLLRRYAPRNDDPSRIASSHIQLTKLHSARNNSVRSFNLTQSISRINTFVNYENSVNSVKSFNLMQPISRIILLILSKKEKLCLTQNRFAYDKRKEMKINRLQIRFGSLQ
jgi:hypothetical protein